MEERVIIGGVDLTDLVGVPYVSSRHPGNVSVREFLENPNLGSNCQLLTLGVLARAGFFIPSAIRMDQGGRFGSQELWLDDVWTKRIFCRDSLNTKIRWFNGIFCAEFDIFFFWPPGFEKFIFPRNFRS